MNISKKTKLREGIPVRTMRALGRQGYSDRKLLTFIIATNRPKNIEDFLVNCKKTLKYPDLSSFKIKIDEGDNETRRAIEKQANSTGLDITIFETQKLDGYYTLHLSYQQMWESLEEPTYFVLPINEEVRFKTTGWDEKLSEYVHFFDDNIFRLKLSIHKYRNYYSFFECGPTPENYPIYTHDWLLLSGGIGDCWGPDGWHQFVDYRLGEFEGIFPGVSFSRSVAANDIQISNEEAGLGLDAEATAIRSSRIVKEWVRMYSFPLQSNFRYLAGRMAAVIIRRAISNDISDKEIMDLRVVDSFVIKDEKNNNFILLNYKLSRIYHWVSYAGFALKLSKQGGLAPALLALRRNYGRFHPYRILITTGIVLSTILNLFPWDIIKTIRAVPSEILSQDEFIFSAHEDKMRARKFSIDVCDVGKTPAGWHFNGVQKCCMEAFKTLKLRLAFVIYGNPVLSRIVSKILQIQFRLRAALYRLRLAAKCLNAVVRQFVFAAFNDLHRIIRHIFRKKKKDFLDNP